MTNLFKDVEIGKTVQMSATIKFFGIITATKIAPTTQTLHGVEIRFNAINQSTGKLIAVNDEMRVTVLD